VRGLNPKLWMAALAVCLFRGFSTEAATTPVYENRGTVDTPVIDAATFLNRGVFQVNTYDQPYDTQNTLVYTNFAGGTISGDGGFRFEYVNGSNGLRRAASTFVNNGSIGFASSGFSSGFLIEDGSVFGGGASTSWLLVDATNIVNRGGLTVDSSGIIRLRGQNISLSRSGVRAGEDPFAPIQQGSAFGMYYRNDAGVSDLYWGAGQNNRLDPADPGSYRLASLTAARPSSGAHEVLDISGQTNTISLPSFFGAAVTNVYVVTNAVSPTNWLIQVVYVSTNTPDPQFKVDVKWGAPRNPSQGLESAKMPIVRLTFEDIDTITTEPYTNYVYVLDNLGAMTNSILITNRAAVVVNTNSQLAAAGSYQRPNSLWVTRTTPPEWARAGTNNAVYKPDLIYNSGYAADTVTNEYAAYSAQIGSGGSSSGSSSGGGFRFYSGIPELSNPTNLPGRVQIEADRLDISLARFRTDGLLGIKAKEWVGSAPYKLDSEIVDVDVGRSTGSLVVSNLIQPVVRRFNGTISAWSAVWTNQTFTTGPDPADPTLQVTNTIDIRFHALIVQHDFVTRAPVDTYRFKAKAPHVVLQDPLTNWVESFVIDAPAIELRTNVTTQSNPITPANFPSLVTLTNQAAFTTGVGFQMGTTSSPVSNVVNRGTMGGRILELNIANLESSGQLYASVGDAVVRNRNLKIEGGSLASAANVWVTADDFKASASRLSAGYSSRNATSGNTNYYPGALILDVTTRLADTGVTASNVWTVYDGFQMVRKPSEGDLLGTTILSRADRFSEVVHTWAAADLGVSATGYRNNSALGTLILDGRPFSLYTFRSATGSPAALYVDYLYLTNYATNIDLALNIEPGFTLYFADSNVPATSLDGAFEGRLRWVRDYAGALSSVPVRLSNGRVVTLNRALVGAVGVDSDGDGIENAFDAAPFEPAALRANVRVVPGSTPARAEISWAGTPGNRYRVEYSSRLEGGEWQTLTTYESAQADPGVMSVSDEVAGAGEPRFYRVVEVR